MTRATADNSPNEPTVNDTSEACPAEADLSSGEGPGAGGGLVRWL